MFVDLRVLQKLGKFGTSFSKAGFGFVVIGKWSFIGVGSIRCIRDKQWPLAPNLPKWRITRANVSRRVTFFSKSPLANVSECIESGLSRVANLANLANF